MPAVKLTAKQQRFVDEYPRHWNAHDAAIAAGYSPDTAYSIGSENLRKPYIKALIDERIKELKATADEVVLRLASHSRGNIGDFLSGNHISLDRARESGKLHLIKKIKTTMRTDDEGELYTTIELELHDAQVATVQLAKILGQFIERVEIYDWRKEAAELGTDPDRLADAFVAMIEQGANGNGQTA